MRLVDEIAVEEEEPRPPEFSDEALALRFSEARAGDLRYVAAWGRWMRWTGTVWATDDTLHAFDLARRECRGAAADLLSREVSGKANRIAVGITSAKTVAAVERLSRSDRRQTATVAQWDLDHDSLNTRIDDD